MITLKTGLPRNGKTLSAVDEIARLLERWEKHPEERREVFQYGITELQLPGVRQLDVWPVGGKLGDAIPLTQEGKPACNLAFDQATIPDGSLIVIDECQYFYPPRGPAQTPPQHVKALNEHGHRNLDYIVKTQHPKLIDNSVRRLVNKHQHYRRMMGGGRAVVYEWDVCSDALAYHTAIKGVFKYPRKRFGLYKSATGFTRPKFRIPLFLIVPALAIPLGIFAGPTAFRAIFGAATGKGISGSSPPASTPTGAGETRTESPKGAGAAPLALPSVRFPAYDVVPVVASREPLAGRALQLEGVYTVAGKANAMFGLVLDGQRVATVSLRHLTAMGYTFVEIGPCAGVLRFNGMERLITCGKPFEPGDRGGTPQVQRSDPRPSQPAAAMPGVLG